MEIKNAKKALEKPCENKRKKHDVKMSQLLGHAAITQTRKYAKYEAPTQWKGPNQP